MEVDIVFNIISLLLKKVINKSVDGLSSKINLNFITNIHKKILHLFDFRCTKWMNHVLNQKLRHNLLNAVHISCYRLLEAAAPTLK